MHFNHKTIKMGDIVKTQRQRVYIVLGNLETVSQYWVIDLQIMKIIKMMFINDLDDIICSETNK